MPEDFVSKTALSTIQSNAKICVSLSGAARRKRREREERPTTASEVKVVCTLRGRG